MLCKNIKQHFCFKEELKKNLTNMDQPEKLDVKKIYQSKSN